MHNKIQSMLIRPWSFIAGHALLLVVILLSTSKTPAQDTARYAKVAEQVVKLINAGDLPAIEKLFNDSMLQALPREKARDFFTRLTTQFGTIEKLDAPVRNGNWTVLLAHCQRGLLDLSLALDRENKIAGIKFTPRVAAPESESPQLSQTTADYTKVARRLVELINARNYAGVQTNFNQEMSAVLPIAKSSAFFRDLTQQMGKIEALDEPQPADGGMTFPAKCEKGALDMQLALDGRGLVAGITFTPRASSDAAQQKHRTQLALPFKDRWLVFWGGDTRAQNQHHDIPAQRFAFDFVGVDENGNTHRGDGAKNEDYFCFGRAIYAPADGVILEAIDGVRDNQPGVMNPYTLIGNCVTIQHRSNENSVLAHLQLGSVAVRAGDQVKRGQLIGRCGNSGNSSEPHLHYQLQNSPIFHDALGIKVRFQQLLTTSHGQSKTKTDYSPIKGDIISPSE